MTRNEMLIYMEQNLIELRGYQDDNLEIAEVLLYAIEEAGMLPPEVKLIPQHIIDNGESPNFWEKE